jgi:hypothetical protein
MLTIRTAAFAILGITALAGTLASAAPRETVLTAKLTGRAETPVAAVNGTGKFKGRVNLAAGKLCYTLTSANLDTLTMAHIHAGAIGVAGPPVVTLSTNVPTVACILIDKDVALKLVANPRDFYVNIHTTKYPKGAVRGQLAK